MSESNGLHPFIRDALDRLVARISLPPAQGDPAPFTKFDPYEVGRRNFTAPLVRAGWTQVDADAEWRRAWRS